MIIDGRHLIGAVLLSFLFMLWYAIHRERKNYNEGYCPICREKWRLFDRDSNGGRGYTCDHCDRTVWISYTCVDGIWR